MPRCIVLHPTDNVATLIDTGRAGEACALQGERQGQVTLLQDVAFGHKVCIAEVAEGGECCKYGQVIGRATQSHHGRRARPCPQHRFGPRSRRSGSRLGKHHGQDISRLSPRDTARAGVRNWIAVISMMDNCNPVTRAISQAVDGTIPVTTMFVRGQFGADLDFALDSLAGMGRNPNIAGVLLVGPGGGSPPRKWRAASAPRASRWRRCTCSPTAPSNASPDGTRAGRAHGAAGLAARGAKPCPIVRPGHRRRMRRLGHHLRPELQPRHRAHGRPPDRRRRHRHHLRDVGVHRRRAPVRRARRR